MTDFTWSELRDKACEAFGDTPAFTTERELLNVFMVRPAAVARELDAIARDVRAGKVRSGWAVARKRLASLKATDAVATDETERQRALAAALQWVRNVGCHYDRESEVLDELTGEHGRLLQWPAEGICSRTQLSQSLQPLDHHSLRLAASGQGGIENLQYPGAGGTKVGG